MNKDRKQTKYGHQEAGTHDTQTEPWHNSPLPKGSSRALTAPSGRGGGRSGGPSGQIRTRTQDGDLQSGTDRQGPWRSWELWKPWRCRELRRPWWSWELWRPWQMVFGGLGLGPLGLAPTAGTLTTPKKKIPWGSEGVSGALRGSKHTEQYMTRQDSRARQTGQDIPQEPEALLGWLGKLRLPLGMTKSQRPSQGPSATASIPRQGGRRLEWPPWPQQEEPPAPDESPRTRQG